MSATSSPSERPKPSAAWLSADWLALLVALVLAALVRSGVIGSVSW
jgi:hypothetical protein